LLSSSKCRHSTITILNNSKRNKSDLSNDLLRKRSRKSKWQMKSECISKCKSKQLNSKCSKSRRV
jgi:hypothetical protein